MNYSRVQQMVDDAIKERDAEGGGRVTHAQLQAQINSAREVMYLTKNAAPLNFNKCTFCVCSSLQGLLRALDTQLHGMRTQMVDDIQNDMDALRNELLTRVSEVKVLASGTKDSLERTQTEMVRVLNKKAYKSEVQKMLQDKVDRTELDALAKEAVVQQMLRAKV
jgi:hypothetical protein